MEQAEENEGKRKDYLLIVIGIFVVGIAVAILLTIYNQNLLQREGSGTIIEQHD